MTEKDWLKILEKDNREDWEWYARWLQDEEDNEIRANTVKWIIKEAKHPEHFKGNTIHAYYWYKEIFGSGASLVGPSSIEADVFYNLESEGRYYKTVLDAKLNLINAREKFLRK
jgi:hypothetical protein